MTQSQREANKFRRDLKLVTSVIGLNLMFFATQLPYSLFTEIVWNWYNYETLNNFLFALFMTFFGLDFFVYFFTNSNFRDEVNIILKLKKEERRHLTKRRAN